MSPDLRYVLRNYEETYIRAPSTLHAFAPLYWQLTPAILSTNIKGVGVLDTDK
jgi:hypothetical protein